MRRFLSAIAIVAAAPFFLLFQDAARGNFLPGSYLCSYLVSSIAAKAGGSNCGLFPAGYTVAWTWLIKLMSSVSGTQLNSTTATVSGTGWCGGLWIPCWDLNSGLDTPFNYSHSTYSASAGVFFWTSTVTSTPPGGAYGTGVGCAASVTTVQPATQVAMAAVYCKSASGSPIIIDTADEGFHLTGLEHGVRFRERRIGSPIQMSWTDPAYHNGWLALPRDDRVTSLAELFGNFTPQPPSQHPNGYIALATYDLNHDGVIDQGDPVYGRLRVWIDANHDGMSQPDELFTLESLGIRSLFLAYHDSKWTDQWGNQFRYESSIDDLEARKDKRTYDVFLLTRP